MTRGRQLGKRLVCALCNAKRYLNGGRVRELTSPVAYPAYPVNDRVVWLVAGDAVCTNHVQCRPQPQRPAEVL